MKRYRVLPVDFDARVNSLTLEINDHWEERVKESHRKNRENIERGLLHEFGAFAVDQKRENFIALGPKPLVILAFHNQFLEQVRSAFVVGAYYPALTAACALGERILNYLILTLRDDFRRSPDYKRIYNRDAFDNWDVPINVLEAWEVLLPAVATEFRTLRELRNGAIHFRPEVDRNDRELALGAIKSLQAIVAGQFGAFGPQAWFIPGTPGECYIKREWESRPFILKIYLPNCAPVGPRHSITSVVPWGVSDAHTYEERDVTDEEFCTLRREYLGGTRTPPTA